MTMPLYASPEQLMRERSELARKGIARGRSVVVLKYRSGVLFVAENPSTTLHKISEIYDRIGFAAVGRYSEYENLRVAGIRHADLKGYQYDRRDVTARALANAYAATLGSIFTEQLKPYEVELCVAEVGSVPEEDQLFRLTYDGSIFDEPRYVVTGGQTEPVANKLKEIYEDGLELRDALKVALDALRAVSNNGDSAPLKLEVAVLDRERPGRKFRRIQGAALDALLPEQPAESAGDAEEKPADGETPPAS
ncbi:proteasome subunit alpha [Amycolatopsis methanolica]|uniref:Proteasome subunit alpha n=1 Tax=Amycolatopsis methanolica 239 TaxID=1068978 RepID=A0A076MSM0_AMYME|nr:proteasome subunit alpha [Amycolatopsis methanolica]AIJ23629.1 20S proteasome subunit (alpha or beta) [Amycolatopsis methanolica 239]